MDNNLINSEEQILDENKKASSKSTATTSGAIDVAVDLLEDIQKIVSSGKPKVVKVRFGDKVVAEIPVALTAAAAVAAGLAAVLLTKLAIEVEHEED